MRYSDCGPQEQRRIQNRLTDLTRANSRPATQGRSGVDPQIDRAAEQDAGAIEAEAAENAGRSVAAKGGEDG